jgi:hypothetical protein
MRHDSGQSATIAAAAAETHRRMLHPCPWPRSGDTAKLLSFSIFFIFLVDAILSCVVSVSQNVSVGRQILYRSPQHNSKQVKHALVVI